MQENNPTLPTTDAITSFHGDYEFLSNFYAHPFEYEGEVYPTAEHAFQAAKTLDAAEQHKVRNAATPAVAKRLGKKVTLRDDWDTLRFEVMEMVIFHKFSDPDLLARLLATGERELIEGNNWRDTTWGCVKDKDGKWKGRNELGKILMHIRTIQRRFEEHSRLPPIQGAISFTNFSALSPLKELTDVRAVLVGDIGRCLEHLAADDQDTFARRAFVRAVFALVEGITHRMREMALELMDHGALSISEEDTRTLRSVRQVRKETGEVREQRLPFKESVKGSLDTFAKVFHVDFVLNYGTQGGAYFLSSAGVRDRLMHPKQAVDLGVSDAELTALRDGYNWFVHQLEAIWNPISARGELIPEPSKLDL